VNVVTLHKALGGGWEIAEPSPDPQSVARNEGEVRENE